MRSSSEAVAHQNASACSPPRGERGACCAAQAGFSVSPRDRARHVKEHLGLILRDGPSALLRMRISPERTSSERTSSERTRPKGMARRKAQILWHRIRCRIRQAPLGAPQALSLSALPAFGLLERMRRMLPSCSQGARSAIAPQISTCSFRGDFCANPSGRAFQI